MSDEENAHAVLSPSSAHCWIECQVAPAMSIDIPDETSEYAEEGTKAHALAEELLLAYFEQRTYCIEGEVDSTMAEHCRKYRDQILDFKREYEATGAEVTVLVEQRLSIEHITGEEGAKGTADCVMIVQWPEGGDLIHVADFKYGYREVSAVENPQLKMYAAAAVEEYSYLGTFDRVRMTIHQPRVNDGFSDFEMSALDLDDWIQYTVTPAAVVAKGFIKVKQDMVFIRAFFKPSEKTCQWCAAGRAGKCAAKDNMVADILQDDFTVEREEGEIDYRVPMDLVTLGEVFARLPFIEEWVKTIRGRVESELLKGVEVPGTKLVQGKKGNRKWADETEVENVLKAMRLKRDEMYNLKLISPTDAAKLLKETPAKWKKVEQYITQAPGSPSVALASDPRPALDIIPDEDTFSIE